MIKFHLLSWRMQSCDSIQTWANWIADYSFHTYLHCNKSLIIIKLSNKFIYKFILLIFCSRSKCKKEKHENESICEQFRCTRISMFQIIPWQRIIKTALNWHICLQGVEQEYILLYYIGFLTIWQAISLDSLGIEMCVLW